MKPRLARHPGVALLLLALMLTPFVAACGANGDDDDPGVATLDDSGDSSDEESDGADNADNTASEDDIEEQMLEFAQCMRDNGVPDFKDPQVDGDGGIIMGGPGGGNEALDMEAVEKAMEECEDLRPQGGGNFSEEDRQEMQDAALEHAQCMRDNGVPDFPDPEFSDGGARIDLNGIDPESSVFQEAQEACEDVMPNRPGGDE
jgi:hypothetical protein